MSTVLLDTNIVSFIFKEDSRVRDYAPLLLHQELAIAPMTVAELYQWAALRHWGETRQQQLEALLKRYTILPIDIPVCREWARLRAARTEIGRPISSQAAWIAATARRYGLPLVTHNPADYERIADLQIITALH